VDHSQLETTHSRARPSPLILNVDDSPANLYAKGRFLRREGFEVVDVSLGYEAVELVRLRRPDLVLLDVNLPDVNGLEVCRMIKQDPVTAATVVIQISASFVDRDDRLRGLSAGADAYMTEPIEPEELVANVRALLRLRRAEEGVRRAAAEWQATFEATRDGVAILDSSGHVLRCNAAFERLLDYHRDTDLSAWLETKAGRLLPEIIDSVHESSSRAVCETDVEHRRVRLSFDPVLDPGAQAHVVCTASDITPEREVRRLNTILEEKLGEMEALFEVIPIGIAISEGVEGHVVRMNAAMAALLGLPRAGLRFMHDGFAESGCRIFDEGGELSPAALPMRLATLQRRYIGDVSLRFERSDGTSAHILASAVPLYDAAGQSRGSIGAFVEITAQVEVERQVRAAHERISAILSSITEAHYVLDREWRFLDANPAAEAIFLNTTERLRGAIVWDAFPGSRGEHFHQQFDRALSTGSPVHFEADLNGSWHEVHAYPRSATLEVYSHDITARKTLEERLRRAKEAAEAASLAKDQFLATVSHELRTPMTAILGWGQMLQTFGSGHQDIRVAADAITSAAKLQASLVDDMLDMARIVTGKLRFEPTPVDLSSTVAAALEAMQPAIEGKALVVVSSLEPVTVNGDENRLHQVAWNLLSNAVKFTPSGGSIDVSVRRRGGAAELVVRDSGLGIVPEFLPYVFDRFSQAEDPVTRANSGLGLGLAIVKHIVELHGGQVAVASEGSGRGSAFTVILPLTERTSSTPPAFSATTLRGLTLLLVEDSAATTEMLGRLLSAAGGQLVCVRTVQDARAALSRGSFDVVITDIALPGESGLILISEICARHEARPSIVAISALGGEIQTQVERFGVPFVKKPMQPMEFIRSVASAAGR
jgi:PAS domain S-box-containing protein